MRQRGISYRNIKNNQNNIIVKGLIWSAVDNPHRQCLKLDKEQDDQEQKTCFQEEMKMSFTA